MTNFLQPWPRPPKPKKVKKPMVRVPLKKSGGKIRQRSKKGREADAAYRKLKAEHFALHPRCQHPSGCSREGIPGFPLDLHHRAGRGPLLCYAPLFATACRPHHDLAKSDIKGSEANGWIVRLNSEQVRKIKEEMLNA